MNSTPLITPAPSFQNQTPPTRPSHTITSASTNANAATAVMAALPMVKECSSAHEFLALHTNKLDEEFNTLARWDQRHVDERYNENEDCDELRDDDIQRFCNLLEIDTLDVTILLISFYMSARRMCVFTRREFLQGFAAMRMCNIAELRMQIPLLRKKLSEDDVLFSALYIWVFDFLIDCGDLKPVGSREELQLEEAVMMWTILLQGRWEKIEDWLEFVRYDNVRLGIGSEKKVILRGDWLVPLGYAVQHGNKGSSPLQQRWQMWLLEQKTKSRV
jgi:DCN1-like protein 1/2